MTTARIFRNGASTAWRCIGIACALTFAAHPASAWILTVTPGAKTIYLQVGTGSYTGGNYNAGGTPANNVTVNKVSVTVAAPVLGTGAAQAMTSDSGTSISFYDGYAVCNPPAQVYVGGWARLPSGSGTAVLTVSTPANLTSGTNTIPFSEISWTSTANGNTTPDVAAGTFNGGSVTLANIAAGSWVEDCHTFSYANTTLRAAGTYTGRATYSLSLP
jgi:hypothetical protein